MNFTLVRPVITEKSIDIAKKGFFTFEVKNSANKNQIKQAIENLFKVHVEKVYVVTRKGKKRLVGRRRKVVVRSDRKRAIAKLLSGEKIDFFEVGKTK